MSQTTPVGQMTTGELGGCMEHARWLLQRKHLLPRELYAKLEAWLLDMQAELEDRAAQEAVSRGRLRPPPTSQQHRSRGPSELGFSRT